MGEEYRAQLELAPGIHEGCPVLELEQELRRDGEPEFLLGTSNHRLRQPLATSWVRAAGVGPELRPQPLVPVPLLQQRLALGIEYEQRECPVQHSVAVVAGSLVERPDLPILTVDQNQRLVIA